MRTFIPDTRDRSRHRCRTFSRVLVVLAVVGLLLPWNAYTQEIGTRGKFKPTAQQLALLPPYCRARVMPPDTSEARIWANRLGPGWGHVHHFCTALGHQNKLRTPGASLSERERRFYLKRIVEEIGYVERRVTPSFPLWSDMMAVKSQASAQLSALEAGR